MTQTPSAMHWMILARFVEYVEGIPDGRLELAGVTRTRSEGFRFPLTRVGEPRELRFGGSVRFTAHAGMLDVVIAEPWIALGETSVQISIVDPDDVDQRFVLADGSKFADGMLSPRLTLDGSDLFFARYPVGFEMDPLSLVASADDGIGGLTPPYKWGPVQRFGCSMRHHWEKRSPGMPDECV